jgi:hypothetical protein
MSRLQGDESLGYRGLGKARVSSRHAASGHVVRQFLLTEVQFINSDELPYYGWIISPPRNDGLCGGVRIPIPSAGGTDDCALAGNAVALVHARLK